MPSPVADIHAYVDGATMAVGCAMVPVKVWLRHRRGKPAWITGRAIVDVLNGVTIVPFLLMLFSAFYQPAFNALIQASMISVSIAGAIGFIFIAGELWET